MAYPVSEGEQLGAHGFKKSMNCAWPWHVKHLARGAVEHTHSYACRFVLKQWAVGNNDVCVDYQLAAVRYSYTDLQYRILSTPWRKFIGIRIFFDGREPAIYRVVRKLRDVDFLFNLLERELFF